MQVAVFMQTFHFAVHAALPALAASCRRGNECQRHGQRAYVGETRGNDPYSPHT